MVRSRIIEKLQTSTTHLFSFFFFWDKTQIIDKGGDFFKKKNWGHRVRDTSVRRY